MVDKHDIESLAHKIVQEKDPALFVVDVLVSHPKAGQKIVIYVDGDAGVSIEGCAEISRTLAGVLDEENLISEQYTLEVSSPGLDQPLKLKRQYKKNIGRNIKVLLQDNQLVKGKLIKVEGRQIIVHEEVKTAKKKTELKERSIAFDDIKKTNVLASFK